MTYLSFHRTLPTDLVNVATAITDNLMQFDTKMAVYFFDAASGVAPPVTAGFTPGRIAINRENGEMWLWNLFNWIRVYTGETWGPWTNINILANYSSPSTARAQYRTSTKGPTFVNAAPFNSVELRGEINYVSSGSTPLSFPNGLQTVGNFNIGADTVRERVFNGGVQDGIIDWFGACVHVTYSAPNTVISIQPQSTGTDQPKRITLDGIRWGSSNAR